METQRRIKWGVKATDRDRRWLWDKTYWTKEEANNYILKLFHGEIIPTESKSLRGYTLRKIKKEEGLEVVKVEIVEVFP